MAKKIVNVSIKSTTLNGVMSADTFNTLMTSNQVGDQFYVPTSEYLLILGNEIDAQDRAGNILKDSEGNNIKRQAGQYFPVVRIVDGVPVEVVDLYVGQLVKIDVNRVVVFPNELYRALRQGDQAFKSLICGKVLTISSEKTILDRVWDDTENKWKRDPNTSKFISKEGRAFEWSVSSATTSVASKATEMLLSVYSDPEKKYKDYVSIDESSEE